MTNTNPDPRAPEPLPMSRREGIPARFGSTRKDGNTPCT